MDAKEQQLRYGVFDVRTGGPIACVAKAKDIFPHASQISGSPTPAFAGTVDDFLATHHNNPALLRQMKNKVRKCPQCGKPVAFTLPGCNQCGHDLSGVEITYTNNVFTGFVYGIEKGPFPFTISLRSQDPDYLVFDDLLSLTPAHLNSVTTSVYMPDWRYLLKDPPQGLKIIDDLFDRCCNVLKEQFLANPEWRRKILRGGETLDIEALRGDIAAGFNYPPSQYQLHLQFMLPPFLPFQYYLYLQGVHFTHQRFFPIEYARKVLRLLIDAKEVYDAPLDGLAIEDTIAHFKAKGVDYDAIHKECYERYGASHRKLANWAPEDFECIVVQDKLYSLTLEDGGASVVFDAEKGIKEEDVKVVQANDKTILQNYGRPYKDNKPTGSYYALAKHFPDGVSAL